MDITPRNGLWIEEIAYLIYDLKTRISGSTDLDIIQLIYNEVNRLNNTSQSNTELSQLILNKIDNINNIQPTTEITVTRDIYMPQQTITVVTNSPIKQKPPTFVFKQNIITPPPKIVKISNKDLKDTYCTFYGTLGSHFVECCKCVDKHMVDYPDAARMDFSYCKDAYKPIDPCVGGEMIMGRCYYNKKAEKKPEVIPTPYTRSEGHIITYNNHNPYIIVKKRE